MELLAKIFFLGGMSFILPSLAERSEEERFCPSNVLRIFKTACIPCNTAERDICRSDSQLTVGSLEECNSYDIRLCRWSCEKNVETMTCCPGYWGPSCIECPGGADNPCNGNGRCEDGNCICDPKYTGIACEQCREMSAFGPNCRDCLCVNGQCDSGIQGTGKCFCNSGYKGPTCSEEILQCKLSSCGDICAEEEDGKIVCLCPWKFTRDDDGICKVADPCTSNPCSQNARCVITGAGKYTCICPTGYDLIGNNCEEINPCRVNNGGCPPETSICRHIGPAQKMCKCNLGYQWNSRTVGCEIIDLCLSSQSECHPMAICTTESVGETTCRCKEGYVGDGRKECFGNVIQRINQLNSNDTALLGLIGKFLTLVSSVYKGDLVKHGNYTIFVPLDSGFRNIEREMSFDELLIYKDRSRQILRQHILPVRVYLTDLINQTLYTLQGNAARFLYKKNKLMFKFRGSSKRTNLIEVGRDIMASNGIIHIVTKLMTHEPNILGDPNKNVTQFIADIQLNKFGSILTLAEQEEVFNKENITVFVPINFRDLPAKILTYLTSPSGKGALIGLLKNYVFDSRMTITDLIDKKHIKSITGTSFPVKIANNGQIFFGNNAFLTQSDIPTKNAIVHLVRGVLFPGDINDILPGKCDNIRHAMIRGECAPCTSSLPCELETDEPTKTVYTSCTYFLKNDKGYIKEQGCERLCRRTYTDAQCCPGFYGPECAPCPGNYSNPCFGNGKCLDGIDGNGTCQCKPGFSGVACQNCVNPDVFGPDCDKKCTCINGVCKSGIYGNGMCKRRSCRRGFSGDDCERRLVECSGKRALCHVYTVCASDGSVSCECLPGYEGNGITCTEVNPCKKPNRGDCHEQATCTYTEPGKNKCTCNTGWTGDGKYCYPAQFCILKTECDTNAVCKNTGPGGFICVCKKGFRGNGKQCQAENPCLINNGGCDPRAKCTMVGIGKRSCVCPVGYAGQGLSCLSTISVEVHDRPELSEFYSLIQDVPDFWPLDEKYTLFAPNNAAILKFKKMAAFTYWQDAPKIINLIAFHTLNDSYNMDTLHQLQGEKFHTVMEGFTVDIFANKTTTIVKTREIKANIVTPDIPADNGYIHIIDQVLEPYPATKNRLTLIEFFEIHKEYSLFGKQLMDTGMVDRLMMMDEYTLFVPLDSAVKAYKKNLSFRFLSYYTLPMMLMTDNIDDGMTIQTMLGQFYQLMFNVHGEQVLVNNLTIIEADILTVGGIIHIIDDLLKPILHRCDNKVIESLKTECISCHQEPNCPVGYEKTAVLKHTCSYSVQDGSILGCTAICKKLKLIPECCYGYYGPDCNECPGGADYPCSDHGSCSSGMNGTGHCFCQTNFDGMDCSMCVAGYTGPNCSSKADKCGSCGPNAECHETMQGEFVCTCRPGFLNVSDRGCLSSCHAANGGCHQNARCSLNFSGSEIPSVLCTCRDGYYGDGKKSCLPIVNICNTNNGNCSPRAICTFTPPAVTDKSAGKVTCECHESYLGNGTTCNRDIYNTLQFMPNMYRFYELISAGSKSDKDRDILVELLEDLQSNITIFVPISGLANLQNISNLDLENHILLSKILVSAVPGKNSYKTLADQQIEVETDSSGKQYVIQESINKIRIIESNILNFNGYINLIESPLWYDYEIPKTASSIQSRRVVAIIVPIILLLLLVMLAVLYRKYAANMTCREIWQRYKMTSDTKISFAHLKSNESQEMLAPDVQNPIFGPQELLLDEQQQPC